MRAAIFLIGALAAGPAMAQQPAQPRQAPAPAQPAPQPAAQAAPAQPPRAWAVACAETPAQPPRDCRVAAAIMLQPQNQRVAQIVVARQPETRSLGLVFQLPHGTALPNGMAWQVDEGEAQRLPFQTSDAEGVYAGVPLTDDMLAALRRGTQLRLTFVIAARREQVVMPVPLAGFSDAATEFFAAERVAAAPPPAPPAQPPRR